MKNYQHLLASAVVTLVLAGCGTTKPIESVDLPPPRPRLRLAKAC